MEGFNALFFCFITLSTVGFGGIVPLTSVARILAMTEAVFGMFYVTLMIARLVPLYTVEARPMPYVRVAKLLDETEIRRL